MKVDAKRVLIYNPRDDRIAPTAFAPGRRRATARHATSTSRASLGPGLACVAGASACSEAGRFQAGAAVTDVSGGWFDFGIVDGKNKLVPSITFRIRKRPTSASGRSRSTSTSRRSSTLKPGRKTEEEFDEVFLQTVEFSEGNQTPMLTVRPEHRLYGRCAADAGANAPAPLDSRTSATRIFAKQSSTTWVELLTFDITRAS